MFKTNASEYSCEIYRHDIAVILLKVALSTTMFISNYNINIFINYFDCSNT